MMILSGLRSFSNPLITGISLEDVEWIVVRYVGEEKPLELLLLLLICLLEDVQIFTTLCS